MRRGSGKIKLYCLLLITICVAVPYLWSQKESPTVNAEVKRLYHKSTIHATHRNHAFENENFEYQTVTKDTNIKVIPLPKTIIKGKASIIIEQPFVIQSRQQLSKDLQSAIERFSKYISLKAEIYRNATQSIPAFKSRLVIDYPASIIGKTQYPTIDEDESYVMNITTLGLFLFSSTYTGIIRGLATFVQLIERDQQSNQVILPIVNIVDQPRFTWRGLLLDVSRHWMPVSVIERTLNGMELSKLNVLHLHLSDDQGFRVQSIRYKLLHDRYNYFTQKEIKNIVEYARQRCIRIVPEFDMPGHATSWFVGYPELASEKDLYRIPNQFGVLKAVMDPTKESTYQFIDEFFKEMTSLFPDPYFHIGGDEVEGSQWENSESIKQFMKQHNINNKNHLQTYFNKRIHELLTKYGKIMMGWEEIIENTNEAFLSDRRTVVQSWKSKTSIVTAVKQGFKVILSNGYYLDYILPAGEHYKVDPMHNDETASLSDEQKSNVLGGEACMWSEFVTEHTVDSRIWPRILAIAERLWSPFSVQDEKSMYERLFSMSNVLEQVETGLTHISSTKMKLEKLLNQSMKSIDLLHPFMILASACGPCGIVDRMNTRRYSPATPLTTFTDALQSESETIWRLEQVPVDDTVIANTFHTWSLNHFRLRLFFETVPRHSWSREWGQDIEALSKSLMLVGEAGSRILNYKKTKILHPDKNNSMNSWTYPQWLKHHESFLNQLETNIEEIRLPAVKIVRRVLRSIPPPP